MFNGFNNGFNRGNPFLHSSYLPDRQSYYQPRQQYYNAEEQLAQEARARALAEQRARRSQWLPDEDDDAYPDEDWAYGQLGPRERLYLDARKRQQQLERQERMRQEQELARQRAAEEREWQLQLEQREREENEKKRKMLEEQRRLHQAKREHMERLAAERAKANTQRAASRSPSRSPNASPSPAPQERAPTPKPQYDEKHEEAASTIQQRYRIHQSFKSIQNLENKFKELKNGFTFPATIEFLQPGASEIHIYVEARRPPPPEGGELAPMETDGKLAYTSRNYTLHAYVEALSKLLMELDGVDSRGSPDVRNRRRGVVKEIEQEVQRVEVYWKNAWQDYVEAQKEKEEKQEEAVQTDEDMS